MDPEDSDPQSTNKDEGVATEKNLNDFFGISVKEEVGDDQLTICEFSSTATDCDTTLDSCQESNTDERVGTSERAQTTREPIRSQPRRSGRQRKPKRFGSETEEEEVEAEKTPQKKRAVTVREKEKEEDDEMYVEERESTPTLGNKRLQRRMCLYCRQKKPHTESFRILNGEYAKVYDLIFGTNDCIYNFVTHKGYGYVCRGHLGTERLPLRHCREIGDRTREGVRLLANYRKEVKKNDAKTELDKKLSVVSCDVCGLSDSPHSLTPIWSLFAARSYDIVFKLESKLYTKLSKNRRMTKVVPLFVCPGHSALVEEAEKTQLALAFSEAKNKERRTRSEKKRERAERGELEKEKEDRETTSPETEGSVRDSEVDMEAEKQTENEENNAMSEIDMDAEKQTENEEKESMERDDSALFLDISVKEEAIECDAEKREENGEEMGTSCRKRKRNERNETEDLSFSIPCEEDTVAVDTEKNTATTGVKRYRPMRTTVVCEICNACDPLRPVVGIYRMKQAKQYDALLNTGGLLHGVVEKKKQDTSTPFRGIFVCTEHITLAEEQQKEEDRRQAEQQASSHLSTPNEGRGRSSRGRPIKERELSIEKDTPPKKDRMRLSDGPKKSKQSPVNKDLLLQCMEIRPCCLCGNADPNTPKVHADGLEKAMEMDRKLMVETVRRSYQARSLRNDNVLVFVCQSHFPIEELQQPSTNTAQNLRAESKARAEYIASLKTQPDVSSIPWNNEEFCSRTVPRTLHIQVPRDKTQTPSPSLEDEMLMTEAEIEERVQMCVAAIKSSVPRAEPAPIKQKRVRKSKGKCSDSVPYPFTHSALYTPRPTVNNSPWDTVDAAKIGGCELTSSVKTEPLVIDCNPSPPSVEPVNVKMEVEEDGYGSEGNTPMPSLNSISPPLPSPPPQLPSPHHQSITSSQHRRQSLVSSNHRFQSIPASQWNHSVFAANQRIPSTTQTQNQSISSMNIDYPSTLSSVHFNNHIKKALDPASLFRVVNRSNSTMSSTPVSTTFSPRVLLEPAVEPQPALEPALEPALKPALGSIVSLRQQSHTVPFRRSPATVSYQYQLPQVHHGMPPDLLMRTPGVPGTAPPQPQHKRRCVICGISTDKVTSTVSPIVAQKLDKMFGSSIYDKMMASEAKCRAYFCIEHKEEMDRSQLDWLNEAVRNAERQEREMSREHEEEREAEKREMSREHGEKRDVEKREMRREHGEERDAEKREMAVDHEPSMEKESVEKEIIEGENKERPLCLLCGGRCLGGFSKFDRVLAAHLGALFHIGNEFVELMDREEMDTVYLCEEHILQFQGLSGSHCYCSYCQKFVSWRDSTLFTSRETCETVLSAVLQRPFSFTGLRLNTIHVCNRHFIENMWRLEERLRTNQDSVCEESSSEQSSINNLSGETMDHSFADNDTVDLNQLFSNGSVKL